VQVGLHSEGVSADAKPVSRREVRLKIDCEFAQLPQLVSTKCERKAGPLAATGLSSVSRYATMQREELLSLYCHEAKRVQPTIGGRETDRFPNVPTAEKRALAQVVVSIRDVVQFT
jgi:hypothetical protein